MKGLNLVVFRFTPAQRVAEDSASAVGDIAVSIPDGYFSADDSGAQYPSRAAHRYLRAIAVTRRRDGGPVPPLGPRRG